MIDIKPFKGTRPFNEEAEKLIAPSTDHLNEQYLIDIHDNLYISGRSFNNEFIKITWISPSNYLENFYQYEIWRAPDVELTDTSLVAIIPNTAIEHFQDRNAGNGTTWYYSVAVVDINGGKKFSNFISGWSTP